MIDYVHYGYVHYGYVQSDPHFFLGLFLSYHFDPLC
jgi:hypothetical protein